MYNWVRPDIVQLKGWWLHRPVFEFARYTYRLPLEFHTHLHSYWHCPEIAMRVRRLPCHWQQQRLKKQSLSREASHNLQRYWVLKPQIG